MEDILVTKGTAELARDKQFNEGCTHFYNEDSVLRSFPNRYVFWAKNSGVSHTCKVWNIFNKAKKELLVTVPTQALLQRWLREIHRVNCFVLYDGKSYYYQVEYLDDETQNFTHFDLTDSLSYEQALEKGLQETLKLI